MDVKTIGDLLDQTLMTIFTMAAPVLVTGLVIGVLISIVQAATQINEVTLVFIPKMLGAGLVLWLTGPLLYEQTAGLFHEVALHLSHISAGGF